MSVGQRGPAIVRPALQRLAQLEVLEHDWDSYGGLPPCARSLTMARSMMVRMAKRFEQHGVPSEVMPIADGGIQLEWQGRSGALAVNAAPDGSWSYLLIERGPDGRTFEERYGLNDVEAEALIVSFQCRAGVRSLAGPVG
jgi:hypothetical protein